MTDKEPSAGPEAEAQGASANLRADEVASARAGFVLITGAKLWFLVSATILNLGLPRFLGDTALFGDFGTINSLISILNMVLVAGTLQAVSKRVSERPELAGQVRAHALRLQTFLGGALFVLLLIGADDICRELLRDQTLAPYLRIAAVVTLSYAFYASFIGVLNGLRAFAEQALFDIAFATLKVGLIVGLVLAGFGVTGAFAGFAIAAVVVTFGAWWVSRSKVALSSAPSSERPVRLLGFMLKVMGFVFAFNLLIQGDVLVLKRAAYEAFQGAGGLKAELGLASGDVIGSTDEVLRALTASLVGLYRAAKNVSLLPYQGVIALTFVIFPLLSRATFESDVASTRLYVRNALRVSWLIVAAISVGLVGAGEGLTGLLFGTEYGVAKEALPPMIVGMACLAMMYLMGSVLIAASHPLDALVVALVVAFAELALMYAVLSDPSLLVGGTRHETLGILLQRAAWTTAMMGLCGLVLFAWRLKARLQVPLPIASMSACLIAATGALVMSSYGVDWILEPDTDSRLWSLFVRALVAEVLFVVLLVLARQITREDWTMVRSTLSRRKVS